MCGVMCTPLCRGEEGGRCEAFRPRLMFNPLLQRVFQTVQHRALHPDQLLPELDPMIARHLQQSEGVINMAAAPLQRVKVSMNAPQESSCTVCSAV